MTTSVGLHPEDATISTHYTRALGFTLTFPLPPVTAPVIRLP